MVSKSKKFCMDIGPMGPIGEGESLILRVTKNCPWNRCLFCNVYKGKRFELRKIEEIKRDIEAVKNIEELVVNTSWRLGFGGRINQIVIEEVIKNNPEIYGKEPYSLSTEAYIARRSLNNVVNWIVHGKRRVFLQDANSLILRPKELIEILRYLRDMFPDIQTITSYARSKSCAQRSVEQLKELKEAGLSWLFVGIESGCDEVLKYMQKGVSAEEHIAGGQKVMEAGINLAAFVMPGLAGGDEELRKKHILETIRVLNKIRPTEIRIRSLAIVEGSPLYTRWKLGQFKAPTEDQMIDEIKMIIENLNFDCIFETLQMTNVLFNVREKLSLIKDWMLKIIDEYQRMPTLEKLRLRLNKYLYGDGSYSYLMYIKDIGKFDSSLSQIIKEAKESLRRNLPDKQEKVDKAIFAIKSKGIP